MADTWTPKYEKGYKFTDNNENECEIVELVPSEEKYEVKVTIDESKGYSHLVDEEELENEMK